MRGKQGEVRNSLWALGCPISVFFDRSPLWIPYGVARFKMYFGIILDYNFLFEC